MILLHIYVVSINVIAPRFVMFISDEAFWSLCTDIISIADEITYEYEFPKYTNIEPRTTLELIC